MPPVSRLSLMRRSGIGSRESPLLVSLTSSSATILKPSPMRLRMLRPLALRSRMVVFGRVTNGAASDLERATEIARAMVFEWGMSEGITSRTLRADNYALSEETKRLRDTEQARLTDEAYAEAVRLISKHRAPLDRLTQALLEKETIGREEVLLLLTGVGTESSASEKVGVPRVIAFPSD